MKFRPLHGRVVIERIDPEAKTAGGIIIPDKHPPGPPMTPFNMREPGGRGHAKLGQTQRGFA
jgi:chaperonin GroES